MRAAGAREEARVKRLLLLALGSAGLFACATAGSAWIEEPLPGAEEGYYEPLLDEKMPPPQPKAAPAQARSLGKAASAEPAVVQIDGHGDARPPVGGKSLGTFRNTYYDFPSELDFEGTDVELKNGKCETIASVRRGFFEAVCVQGSGTLRQGTTVSFAKRDCACAEICPRTSQKICFDALDAKEFPWGRGATGKPITPLLTVAVDADVIPLGTPLYVPEYDGLPRDPEERTSHDGCFIAQDRGLKVKGQHLDIFTGHRSMTQLWNRLVPSNKGITVVLESPRCARAAP
jgi:3D (Asp-Asp-Asp) domain-containing protein